jgi:hypothetical protein
MEVLISRPQQALIGFLDEHIGHIDKKADFRSWNQLLQLARESLVSNQKRQSLEEHKSADYVPEHVPDPISTSSCTTKSSSCSLKKLSQMQKINRRL